jgi:hypothetical protein
MVLAEEHSSLVIVALVQTASLGPTLVFALFANGSSSESSSSIEYANCGPDP